ncbi:hypothetical protein N7539_006485 [Penicillium diatomitis]|uniref:Inner centromere protein ARK-binding domain-containing protein n=1 Tax=Penicillium diatomitis TaxID=2819901 RepID=A0A9X0BTF0_9EURO|nr:uncharacterized protein N7539_006485 [Penicillium diatomitis]KAJ5483039.1 hypothetical protein N7539_006485 [Penicillium diatomitis]
MATATARARKPVGSAPWVAAEKENITDLVRQELEEVEYPVRHELDWLNEHMAEIFSKGQANFTDVFKTPGKMVGKTPRTARKRPVEENRVPLSEIFSSTQKNTEKKAVPSPSPFVHRVMTKSNAAEPQPARATSPATSPTATRSENVAQGMQLQYPDLTQKLNSFSQFNTDSGYHGLQDDNDIMMSDTQPETQSTQPFEEDDQLVLHSEVDVSLEQQPTEDSFHSAQENMRLRGETVEPRTSTPTPKQPPISRSNAPDSVNLGSEANLTPKARKGSERGETAAVEYKQQSRSLEKQITLTQNDRLVDEAEKAAQEAQIGDLGETDVDMEADFKEDPVLDEDFDDIGSPSDGSTPERFPMRKSSLNFASLPAREPLKGPRVSRTSHIDLPKLNHAGRTSLLGKQLGASGSKQAASDDDDKHNASDGPKNSDEAREETLDVEQVSRIHNKKSTQSLHERISMLGKVPPSRHKISLAATAATSAGQIPYPEIPATKAEIKPNTLASEERTGVVQQSKEEPVDEWIRPMSSPQRLDLTKSKTFDVNEKLSEQSQSTNNSSTKDMSNPQPTEPQRPKSSYSIFSSPRPHGHFKTASVSNITSETSTTPTGSPRRFEGPLSASKMRLQSIMKSAKGLFSSTAAPTRVEVPSPEQQRLRPLDQVQKVSESKSKSEQQPRQHLSPPRHEGRRTRSSTEKEEKRRQQELEDRQREEDLKQEKAREQEKEKQRVLQVKSMQDKSSIEPEDRPGNAAQRPIQAHRQQSREPDSVHDGSRFGLAQSKQADRRPRPPTREPTQKSNPRPVSIRVGSTLSRPMSVASSIPSNSHEPAVVLPAPTPASTVKAPTLKKKGSNQSLHAASTASSLKSSVLSQTQAQRKRKEQEEREARRKEEQRKEEQKREFERKRALQKQQEEEARRQAEAAERERLAQDDPKKSAHMRAIERRRQENNARKGHVRQGSQQALGEASILQHEKAASQSSQRSDMGAARPASRLAYGRPMNAPAPNPAKPPKRNMDEESGHRSAMVNASNVQPSGEAKRRKTEDEHNPVQPVRPTMAPPIRQSSIRKQPSMFGQSASSIFKTGQAQRPAHPSELAKYSSNKIPFAEPSHAPAAASQKTPGPSSAQRPPSSVKPSPKYPNGENIHLPEIATDSEDEDDSDSEMFPVPKWAQPKELEDLLRVQEGMEVDSIFGPIAPFSLEETFKADKKIKKYRDRTSSANWNGPDGLTQEEIRKDRLERQKLRLNGGWSFH